MRRVALLGALGLCAWSALVAAHAHAHSLPFGTALVWPDAASTSPPLVVSNRGLIFASAGSGPREYSIRCQQAYEASTSDRPSVFLQADGTLTVGVYYQVFQTSDRGCSVKPASGLPDLPISDPVASGIPGRLFLSTRNLERVAGVYMTDDYGASWTQRFENNPREYYEQLLAAPSDPASLYATGSRVDVEAVQVTFYTSRSRDGGATWQDFPMPAKIIPFAVHPRNSEVVFAYRATDKLESVFNVLRSEDSGATFALALEGVRMPTDLVASEDGSVLFLGIDRDDGGLFRSSDDGRHFERALDGRVQRVTCLAQHGGRLWLCGNMAPNVEGVWVSDDQGMTFQSYMSFADVTQPVVCEGAALALCAGDWYDFDLEVRPASADASVLETDAGVLQADAGVSEAGDLPVQDAQAPGDAAVIAHASARRGRGSSGCSAAGGEPSASVALPWIALLAIHWRRRRARPPAVWPFLAAREVSRPTNRPSPSSRCSAPTVQGQPAFAVSNQTLA